MGVMSLAEYRSKWYGEDLKTAKAKLPEAEMNIVPDDAQLKLGGGEGKKKTTSLNGAQTQSLISIMGQYASGQLKEGQAVNLIATSIGIDKDEARTLLNGEL